MTTRTERPCAAPDCATLSSRNGEHVIPEWLVRSLRDGIWSPGPFTVESSRNGTKRTSEQAAVVKLPLCVAHNKKLNRAFEQAGGKDAVRKLLGVEPVKDDRGKTVGYQRTDLEKLGPLTYSEANALGRWLVKTILIAAHSEAVWEMEGVPLLWCQEGGKRVEFPEHVYAELFDGIVPDGVHAWICISELEAGDHVQLKPDNRVVLCRAADGRGASHTLGFGIRHGQDGRCLHLQVVWQPSAVVVHPDQETGRAAQVWPSPRAGLRLADLPVLTPVEADQFGATFISGGTDLRLEPDGIAIFGEGLPPTWFREHDGHHDLRWFEVPEAMEERLEEVRTYLEREGVLVPPPGMSTDLRPSDAV